MMRFSIAALLLALPAFVSAIPVSRYDARFAALSVRHARVAQRGANPLVERGDLALRQNTCSTQCSSSADTSGVNALDRCASNDAVCVCNALESLSNTCLSCVMPAIGLSSSEFNQLCGSAGTTNQCDSQCSDATDVSANQAAGECPTSSLTDPCVCAALGEMTTNCRNCLLQVSGISSSDYTQACSATSSTGGGFGTATSSAAGSTATGGSGASCNASCSSTSDQSALSAGEACGQLDTVCQCNALAKLSSGCLTCFLSSSGISNSQYQSECSVVSRSFTGAGATSTTSSAAQPTSSSGSSSGGGFTVPSCNSSCGSSGDQTAISQGNACGPTDVNCACKAFNAMDVPCRACILSSNGLTQQDLNSQCAAASSQASASSTAGPSGSNLPNTGGGTQSGDVSIHAGAGVIGSFMAVALGAMIFV